MINTKPYILWALTVFAVFASSGAHSYSIEDKISSNALDNAALSFHDYSEERNLNRKTSVFLAAEDSHDHEDDDHGSHDHDDDEHDSHDDDDHDDDEPWQEIILASLLVNLITLTGIVIFVPLIAKAANNGTFWSSLKGLMGRKGQFIQFSKKTKKRALYDIALTSFACGAVLACAVFLIIPESIHLLNGGHDEHDEDAHDDEAHDSHEDHDDDGHDSHDDHEESNVAWKFGVGILGGFLLPVFLGALFPRSTEHECTDECVEQALIDSSKSPTIVEEGDVTKEHSQEVDDISESVNATDEDVADGEAPTTSLNKEGQEEVKAVINYRLCCSVLVGDFFHNFGDGIFIGTAFTTCSRTVAYGIVLSTVYHELAQEIGDFFLLVNHAGLTPLQALGVNFISGLSVLLGGLVVLAIEPGNTAVGVILSLSAGVYIHLAAGECLPRIDNLLVSAKERLISLAFFILGSAPIGLVLLNHEHCG